MSFGSCMQIRYMHKLNMHDKADFANNMVFAQCFELLRLMQILRNFEQQYTTPTNFPSTKSKHLSL